MSFIFISYSRQDQAYVSLLAQVLQSHNLPVWIDDRIDYGTTWPRVIQDHLERCQAFVVVMSPRSEDSHWVQCELSLALELKKPIFPLLLEGRRWLSVAAIQSVDVAGGTLPPARFFDTLRTHFPAPSSTAESLLVQEVAADAIPAAPIPPVNHQRFAGSALVGWAPPITTPGQKPAPAQPVREDDLSSEKGVDYRKLRDLLKAREWEEADRETDRRMLETVGRKDNDWIRPKELQNFPCADLRTIDTLWVKYSQGKWGFSVQKRIYVECGAKLDCNYPGDKIWHEFCRRVGWRTGKRYMSYSDLTCNPSNSPEGEFPCRFFWGGEEFLGGLGMGRIMSLEKILGFGVGDVLFSRTETCKL